MKMDPQFQFICKSSRKKKDFEDPQRNGFYYHRVNIPVKYSFLEYSSLFPFSFFSSSITPENSSVKKRGL